MIYKIISDFNQRLREIIEHFAMSYDTMFYNNVLYIGTNEEKINIKQINQECQKAISGSFYVIEINENNLKYEPDKVVEWCKQLFIDYDTYRFEQNKQIELQAMLKFIQDFEHSIQEINTQIHTERGETNGRKETNGSTREEEKRETTEE